MPHLSARKFLTHFNRSVSLAFSLSLSVPALAEATPLVSVDLQSSYGMQGAPFNGVDPVAAAASPVFEAASVWNVLGSSGFNVVDPSFPNLVDNGGNPTTVGFSIVGSISAYGTGNPLDALLSDYFYWNTPGAISTSIAWSITGLAPSRRHLLFVNGANAGAFTMRVDEDADGNIGNDAPQTVSSPGGAGVYYSNVMSDAVGTITGLGTYISGEAKWAGFQVLEAPDVAFCSPTPLVGCAAAAKGSLKIQDNLDDSAKRKLSWKWQNGTAHLADLGDPVGSTTNYRLCVYDDGVLNSSPAVTQNEMCEGESCWTASSTGQQYKNKLGNASGITKVKMKAGTDKAQIQVSGKGAGLALSFPFAATTAVTAQLVMDLASGSSCWESVFVAPVKINDTGKRKFMGKMP